MKYFYEEIKIMKMQYNIHLYFLINYFVENKRIYLERENYNYNLIPMDIRSNSYLEKYNKDKKDYLSENKECNRPK